TDVSIRTVIDPAAPGNIGATSGDTTVKPVGAETEPTLSTPVPELVTRNVRVGAVAPLCTVPKLIAEVAPSATGVPLVSATATSGVPPAPGWPTVPLTANVNGVSLESLVVKRTCPDFAPVAPAVLTAT